MGLPCCLDAIESAQRGEGFFDSRQANPAVRPSLTLVPDYSVDAGLICGVERDRTVTPRFARVPVQSNISGGGRMAPPEPPTEVDGSIRPSLRGAAGLDDRRASRIAVYRAGSIDQDPQALGEIRAWMIDRLLRFRKVFGPLLAREAGDT